MIAFTDKLRSRIIDLAFATTYVSDGILMAVADLLRILKSSASRGLDTDKAKAHLFMGINLCHYLSVSPRNATARAVTVVNQLWHSTKAFRKSDGSEYTTLRIRSRLGLSPGLDALYWWRDVCDPQYRFEGPDCKYPFSPSLSSTYHIWKMALVSLTFQAADTGTRENVAAHMQAAANMGLGPVDREQDRMLFDDPSFADFEWSLGDDGLLPTLDPYASA